jgi:hypothetical protein
MAQKSKMMQYLRKLQEVQVKYAETVNLEVRIRKYQDDGCIAVSSCFISQTKQVEQEDGRMDAYIVNADVYTFYMAKENKRILDKFIKEVCAENQRMKDCGCKPPFA